MKPILLGVNIDHVATLRQARGTSYPDPVEAAQIAIAAGADSITVHLREDRRHIQDRDVHALQQAVTVPLNLELAVTGEMLRIAGEVKPAYCCFVPERREELTTEGGLDVRAALPRVREACAGMADAGILASLFIDADEAQIRAAAEAGARVIEIHTGHYADAGAGPARDAELARVAAAVTLGVSLGLSVNAGHGLNYDNIGPIAALERVHELNIGHAIISRAVLHGLGPAVADMKRLLHEARA